MTEVDVLIVGGGVAGLSCALYTSKAGLSTLVINHGKPQLQSVEAVWNIPGIDAGVSGASWLDSARSQVTQLGGILEEAQVESMSFSQRPYFVLSESQQEWAAKYVVLATNLGYSLLERHGFEVAINEHVPSRKIRKVNGINYDGKTQIPGVYIAGLLTDIPSQTVIAAGQGAFVGVQIASDHLGRPFMWHD